MHQERKAEKAFVARYANWAILLNSHVTERYSENGCYFKQPRAYAVCCGHHLKDESYRITMTSHMAVCFMVNSISFSFFPTGTTGLIFN